MLQPRDPRAPPVAAEAESAAARFAADPYGAFQAQVFVRSQARWNAPQAMTVAKSVAAGDGDVLAGTMLHTRMHLSITENRAEAWCLRMHASLSHVLLSKHEMLDYTASFEAARNVHLVPTCWSCQYHIRREGGARSRAGRTLGSRSGVGQGLTLVHFSAEPEPFLSLKTSPKALSTPSTLAINTP